ncbi:hypothetical protein Bpfe_019493, partial [Biomphalaria pfeifferi]
ILRLVYMALVCSQSQTGLYGLGLQPVSDWALWLWFAASLRLGSMALVCSQSQAGLYGFDLHPVSDWALWPWFAASLGDENSEIKPTTLLFTAVSDKDTTIIH